MKNKQDILKLHPMIGILTPMQWDEIHKAMDAYLNEYKAEQLTLTDVVDSEERTELPASTIPEFGTDEWIDCCEQLFGGMSKSR